MRKDTERPADTRLMGIVHDALRRDLGRCTAALSTPTPPPARQRKALAAHARWLMDFLDAHHEGEDRGLWPLLQAVSPAAGPMANEMAADHARIGVEVSRVRNASTTYGTDDSPSACLALIEAVTSLRSVLEPHLRREEDEMMPVVSAALTHAQWRTFNDTTYVKHKSKRQLAQEGHWLIDGIDPDCYEVVVGMVSPVPRFILVHAMAAPYRRACAIRWGPQVRIAPQRRARPSADHSPR